jgi:hypothetical protein
VRQNPANNAGLTEKSPKNNNQKQQKLLTFSAERLQYNFKAAADHREPPEKNQTPLKEEKQ